MHSLTDLKRAVVLAPTDARARFELAEALFAEEQFTQAAAQLEKALELSPDDSNAHRMLARCYERGGSNEKALKTLENFVRQRPDDADAREELVGYFLQQGRPDDAILHAAEAVRLQPTDVQRMVFLADLLLSRRLPERAREVLEVAHKLSPEEPKVTRLLKDVYELLGDDVAGERIAGEKERGYFLRQAKLAANSKVLADEAQKAGLSDALALLAKGDDVGLSARSTLSRRCNANRPPGCSSRASCSSSTTTTRRPSGPSRPRWTRRRSSAWRGTAWETSRRAVTSCVTR